MRASVFFSFAPFALAFATLAAACSSTVAVEGGAPPPSSGNEGDPGGGGTVGGTSGGSSSDAGSDAAPARDATAATDAGPIAPEMRPSTRVDGSAGACSVVAGAAGVFFATTSEVRAVVDAGAGTSRLVTTLSASTKCPRIAVSDTTVYVAREVGTTGELLSVPVGGGAAALVGTIPARAPVRSGGGFPLVTTESDVFVAASPNVWHLPATSGVLTKLAIDSSNFYVQDLLAGSGMLYAWTDGSNQSVVRFGTAGGASTGRSGVVVDEWSFVRIGDAIYMGTDSPGVGVSRIPTTVAVAPEVFVATQTTGLVTDGSLLYVARMPPTSPGSGIEAKSIAVFTPTPAGVPAGAPLREYRSRTTYPAQPSITADVRFKGPMAVDGTHLYVIDDYVTLIAIPK